ncbi:SCO3374 family protein [Streptomyces sp. NPDC051561]|uniref:SCO3374 family protein n=1 Tax=Streptomyces sp. NPDC051561 TaxID=3365658 RepID=UPI0037B86F19
MPLTVPPPRLPPPDGDVARWVSWYEDELGWPVVTAPGEPLLLRTGIRFDVLELPAAAGRAVLRRAGPTGPVALLGRRMRFLVAAGSAEEVPGLLEWLEWGSVGLDLRAVGPGGLIAAPAPPGTASAGAVPSGSAPSAAVLSGAVRAGGAAIWLRPPAPAGERELPAFTGFGGSGIGGRGSAPDLVRLLAAAATECHRDRLIGSALNTNTALSKKRQSQPLAFS